GGLGGLFSSTLGGLAGMVFVLEFDCGKITPIESNKTTAVNIPIIACLFMISVNYKNYSSEEILIMNFRKQNQRQIGIISNLGEFL
ncbi:MAG TPA: hypothetical protein VNB22_21695, partial [Pyrinomonadaceae bacterium]|nr:hypothetical protein [Pyrinomonadaceae bacterium]